MTAPAPPLSTPTSPDEPAPPRPRARWVLGGAAVLALLGVVAAAFALTLRQPAPAAPALAPAPAPPRPAPSTPTTQAPVDPFSLTVASVQVDSLDNAELFGAPPPPPPTEIADAAVQGVRAALRAYLDAQFVQPDTRFTDAPVTALLTDAARGRLAPDAQRGLGVLDGLALQVVAGTATADFRVLTGADDVAAVTVAFEATAEGNPGGLVQRGSMVFVPVGGEWRADAVDVVLEIRP